MPKTIFEPARGQRVPVVVWARDASAATIEQLLDLASQPWVTERVCAMADAHVAEGVSVGTVFATSGTYVPRALGGDLGCGIAAVRLSVESHRIERDVLERFVATFARKTRMHVPESLLEASLSTRALEHARMRLAPRHLGTLGGGNHFLEIDRDADGATWLLVHSGSRGLGAAMAAHHTKIAATFDQGAREGIAYASDLEWAVRFARANREALADRAIALLSELVGVEVTALETIDVPHNLVTREVWDGRALLVHRKGAVHVPLGALAVVPGSMATASYIVRGVGCVLAYDSCSHGAGRVMTRGEARRRVRPEALARAMRRIAWPSRDARRLVEEAPDVYRNIGDVLDDQRDLVARERRLEPLAVVKE